MKYLFFDCEFASCLKGKEKICEFGFVVTDEHFKVLARYNYIINPNIDDKEWDTYALKNILNRKKYEYIEAPLFPTFYERIINLIKNSDYIFGHSNEGDVHALECEFQRYGLRSINYDFYDIKEFYKLLKESSESISLENMIKELRLIGDDDYHDAEADSYNTMLVLKEILKRKQLTLSQLIEKCPNAKDFIKDGEIYSREQARLRFEASLESLKYGDYSDGTNRIGFPKKGSNRILFAAFCEHVEPTSKGNDLLRGKKIAVSKNYESNHFKEMMNLVQLIYNESGVYTSKGSECDLYVSYESFKEDGTPSSCPREKSVDIEIRDGKSIEKIEFVEFLKILNLTNEQLEAMPFPKLNCLFASSDTIRDTKTRIKVKRLMELSKIN